jgi:hypothetical protein
MTIFTFANNVSTTLASPISPTATTLTLSSATGLPTSIPTGETLVITLNDRATRNNFEVIYATTVSGATLGGLSRGQEGTTAASWLASDYAYNAPTAGQMGSLTQVGQFPSSLVTAGYKKYPDPNSPTGYYIEQWGTANTADDVGVNFPFAFPNACLNVVICESNAQSATWGSGLPTVHGVSSVTVNGFAHWTLSWTGSAWVGAVNTGFWRAIGY